MLSLKDFKEKLKEIEANNQFDCLFNYYPNSEKLVLYLYDFEGEYITEEITVKQGYKYLYNELLTNAYLTSADVIID